MEKEINDSRPLEQIVVATVQLVNRSAESAGLNGRLTPKPMKAMLKFRNRSQGRISFLQVSTRKDTLCPKFDVDTIKNIRSNLMEQGMVTIQTNEMTIMIKDGRPQELQSLLNAINLAKAQQIPGTTQSPTSSSTAKSGQTTTISCSKGKTPSVNRVSDVSSKCQTISSPALENTKRHPPSSNIVSSDKRRPAIPIRSQNSSPPNKMQSTKSTVPLRQSTLNFQSLTAEQNEEINRRKATVEKANAVKRRRSPSPPSTKGYKTVLHKALCTKGVEVVVKIGSKLNYLQGFSASTTNLSINEISMKKLDSRLLALRYLHHLNLSNNKLTSVDSLRNLNSTLSSLNLSNNQIVTLDPRLRFTWSGLTILDLSNNGLKMLPDSFVFLSRLRTLDISHNELRVLPFNIHLLRGLRTLLANDNNLICIPDPMHNGLCALELVDLSNNPELILPIPNPNAVSPGWGSTDERVPNLMELSATALLTGVSVNRPELSFENWPEGIVPLSLMEYLYRAKRCAKCRVHVTRYLFKDSMGYGRSLGQQVVCNGPSVRLRSALCPHHLQPR